ncbi:ABC transporter ATP-binding protein [Desulfonatronovibrio magnus]|uniref:ABC transporter ATP-binding protein n=1 Tax=Desulfonatronovibrio magnus TaxID=698827 RepID=UPI000697C9A3|nr:ABC transporter ATP-binding protein [Desulfonatronovibrio magnus]
MNRIKNSLPESLPLIKTANLCKSYTSGNETVHPLYNVNMEILHGEFIAIMGPSGTGKSTLLHILGCLDRPDSGSYHLNGKNILQLDDIELSLLRASKIGFVFQAYNLISQCTLIDNVAMPFLYHPAPPENIYDLARTALKKVGLAERETHRPNQLSGGEMQRAAIARALIIKPLVVLADEPTGNLDNENTKSILNLFHEMHWQGTTLIVVTHDDEVAEAADRVCFIKNGSLSG